MDEHSEGKTARQIAGLSDDWGAPKAHHDAVDLLHQMATQQEADDQADAQRRSVDIGALKGKVIEALQAVHSKIPVLAKLKETDKDTYESLMSFVRSVIAIGRGLTELDSAEIKKHEQELVKAIEGIKGRPNPGGDSHNYDHLLKPDAKEQGYSLNVTENPEFHQYEANLMHHGTQVGVVMGFMEPGGKYIEPHSELDKEHRGKGLGVSMYEALYNHAKANGIKEIKGHYHSEDARHLHEALARRHGFDYAAEQRPKSARSAAQYPYEGYRYTLKGELEMSSDDGLLCKGDHPHHPRKRMPEMPPGTLHNGKLKVTHSDGTSSWKGVKSGMIQGQEPNSPFFGANSHPVSSRNPESK